MSDTSGNSAAHSAIGFWRCWAISVGIMIGSGIFLLPSVLAPYGSISLLGWLATSIGVVCLALVLARLAHRTEHGAGGPYAYARDAFGNLAGFLIGWGYWLSVAIASAAIALAFAGYLAGAFPLLEENRVAQTAVALLLIWLLTAVNAWGVAEGALVQLVLTVLKIISLALIVGAGFTIGSLESLPAFNPQELPPHSAIATTALLTMWAFAGIEAAVIPADDVVDAQRTIPRAIVFAAVSVAALYMLVTVAVMMLVPLDRLAQSEAPFIDAASVLGPWGGAFVAFGALVSTAGSLNGNILVAGQMPLAAAMDGNAPRVFGHRNQRRAPVTALVFTSALSSVLLCLNFTTGLLEAFTFLISVSTLCVLAPYGVSAVAELIVSWRRARAWALLALVTLVYTLLAATGSGAAVLLWGAVLMSAGVPLFFTFKHFERDQPP